jgi:hypothetical protein
VLLATGFVLILGGFIYGSNVRGASFEIYSAMHRRWTDLNDGFIRRSVRLCFAAGSVPFWAFRLICSMVMVGVGVWIVIW